MGRDPLKYTDGHGLYRAWFVPNALDPSGLRSLSASKQGKCGTLYVKGTWGNVSLKNWAGSHNPLSVQFVPNGECDCKCGDLRYEVVMDEEEEGTEYYWQGVGLFGHMEDYGFFAGIWYMTDQYWVNDAKQFTVALLASENSFFVEALVCIYCKDELIESLGIRAKWTGTRVASALSGEGSLAGEYAYWLDGMFFEDENVTIEPSALNSDECEGGEGGEGGDGG